MSCSGADKCDAHEDGSDGAPDQGKRVWRPKSENRPADGLPVRYVRHGSAPSFRDVDLNQRALPGIAILGQVTRPPPAAAARLERQRRPTRDDGAEQVRMYGRTFASQELEGWAKRSVPTLLICARMVGTSLARL